MQPKTIRVYAVEGLLCALFDHGDQLVRGRYAARDAAGVPMPDGEDVPDVAHHRRALDQGDLASAPPRAPAAPPAPSAEVPS